MFGGEQGAQYLCNLYETISDKCNILGSCCGTGQRRIVVTSCDKYTLIMFSINKKYRCVKNTNMNIAGGWMMFSCDKYTRLCPTPIN